VLDDAFPPLIALPAPRAAAAQAVSFNFVTGY
jgi:hypothetical protein